MNIFPASASHEPRRALVSYWGTSEDCVGKKQEFPVC